MLSVLAFDSMDDPHIQWLQMACAIWGEKYNFNILQSNGISFLCAAHWSMKRKIFPIFCPYVLIQMNKKLHKSRWSHPWIGIWCIFGEEIFTFLKHQGLLYLTVTSGEFSLCHHCCNLAEQWPSASILFHHGKNHLCMSTSYWAGEYRKVQFHQY